jgi:hypothetical protein
MTKPAFWIAALAAAAISAACTPAFDWREFVPEGSDVSVRFPCRPDRSARLVAIAGATVQMQMLACSAGNATFALAFVEVADPARIGATLAALRDSAVANVRGGEPRRAALQIQGMTPNEQSGRLAVTGRLPDGAAVQEQAAFFTRGLRVYQATVIGAAPSPEAVETFIGGLKFPE